MLLSTLPLNRTRRVRRKVLIPGTLSPGGACYTGGACPIQTGPPVAREVLHRVLGDFMSRVRIVLLGTALACLIAARPDQAQAQADSTMSQALPAPAHISVIDGTARIEREGRVEDAVVNVPVLEGDRIRTESGRVEIVMPDGSALHMDQSSSIDLLARDLFRLNEGRVLLIVAGADDPSSAVRYQIDAPAASVQVNSPGEYRIVMQGDEVALEVVYGDATFATDTGSVPVRAGERSVAVAGSNPSSPQYFNAARSDAFDQWSDEQRGSNLGQTSVRYLPQDLRTYAGTFDRYGSWSYDTTYGNVWYPSASDNWRPYTDGYWGSYPVYGSVWVGSGPWSWPTHHYGRWGISLSGRWFWIPGRVWGPAWVYWAVNQDYVGWCPLGWNDYPVFGMWGVRGAFNYAHYDPWRAWTVVPRNHFGRNVWMSRVAIDGRGLDDRVRGAFVAQRTPPRQYAVPRSAFAPRADDRSSGLPRPGTPGLAGMARGTADRFRSNDAGQPQAGRAEFRGNTRLDRPGLTRPADSVGDRTRGAAIPYSRRAVPGAPAGSARDPRSMNTPRRDSAPSATLDRRAPRQFGTSPQAGPGQSFNDRSLGSAAPRINRPDSSSYAAPRQRYETPMPPQSAPRQPSVEAPRPDTRRESPGLSRDSRPGGGVALPRYSAPSRGPSPSYSSPGYSAPPRTPSSQYSAPRNSTPPRTPSSQYSAPGYSAPPRAPSSQYSAPRYSTPPRAPSSQYSAPGYSAPPRAPSSQYSAPRYSAPSRAPSPSSAGPAPRYNSGGSAPRAAAPSRGDSRPRGNAGSSGSARPRGPGSSRR